MAHNKIRRGRMNFGHATQRRGCRWMLAPEGDKPMRPCGAVRVKHQLCGLHKEQRRQYAEQLNIHNDEHVNNPKRRAKSALQRTLSISGRQWVKLRKARQQFDKARATAADIASHPGWNPLLRLAAALRDATAKAA